MDNVQNYYNNNAISWSSDIGLYPLEELLINSFFPKAPAKILDIGCGSGRTTHELAKRGYSVVGIDISSNLLKIGRHRAVTESYGMMDAVLLGFPASSFDVVMFSFNGIDCIFPRKARLKVYDEIQRVAKPKGIFYYTSHNVVGQLTRYFRSVAWASFFNFLKSQIGNRHIINGYWEYGSAENKQTLFARGLYYEITQINNMNWKLLAVFGAQKFKSGEYSCLLNYQCPSGHESGVELRRNTSIGDIFLNCAHIHYIGNVNQNGL
jgi:ubiquinone/menaquinone biosynthesis C-methylase UbiE